jgi:hypothetical protein
MTGSRTPTHAETMVEVMFLLDQVQEVLSEARVVAGRLREQLADDDSTSAPVTGASPSSREDDG